MSLRIMLFTNHVTKPNLVQRLIHNDHNPEMWKYTRYPKSFHQHFFNLTAETAASFEISKLLLLSAVTRPSEVDAAANSLSIKCNMQSRSVTVIRVATVIFTRTRPEERDRRIFRRYAPVNAVR